MGQLGHLIKVRRAENSLSQSALAEMLSLQDGRSYISRIENGRLIPSRARIDALERALGFQVGVLQSAATSDELTATPTAPTHEGERV